MDQRGFMGQDQKRRLKSVFGVVGIGQHTTTDAVDQWAVTAHQLLPPTALETPEGVERVDVRTAEEMLRAVQARFSPVSIAIFAAAVADYRPAEPATAKIKRTKEPLTIRLEPNPDILATMAKEKGERLVVGFAAETDHVAENARKKLTQKNADLIVANDVSAEGAGFDVDTNIVTIFSRDARDLPLPRMTKAEVAQRILDEVLRLRGALRSKPASHRAGD